MIYLEKGQKVFEKPELVVYEQTGERNDVDMVICAKAESPEEPFCWLEAQYIAYGNVVYSISDDKELEKEILKMDPDSTINDVANAPVENVAPAAEVQPQPQTQPAPEPAAAASAPQQDPTPTPAAGDPVSGSGTQAVEIVPPGVEPSATSTVPAVEPASTSTAPIAPVETVVEQPAVPTGEPVLEIPTPEPIPVEVVEPVVAPAAPDPVVSFSKRKSKRLLS